MSATKKTPDCRACSSPEPHTIDRFLCMPDDWAGKRGPRSLAGVFGLDRRDIAKHRDRCLVGERREEIEADLMRMAEEAAARRSEASPEDDEKGTA